MKHTLAKRRTTKSTATVSSSKWQTIALCSLVYFISYFTRKDFAVVMAALINQGFITKATGGWIGTALFISYGTGQVLCGILADRFPPRYLLGSGLILTGICNAMMPTAINAGLAIPLWAVNGFAQAFMWPPIVRILADSLDEETFVTANLIVTSAAHAATMLLYLFVPLCLNFFSWQFVFLSAAVFAAIALLCVIIGLTIVLPKNDKINHTAAPACRPHMDSFWKTMCSAGVLPLIVCIVAMGYLRDGIESWMPTLYCEAFQKSESEAILLSILLPAFSVISITVITAAHRFRAFNNEANGCIYLFFSAAAICIPLCFLLDATTGMTRILCLLLAAVVCGCMHASNFLLISCLPGRFSKYGMAATVSGICNAFVYIGAAISMYGIPAIAQSLGWNSAILSWMFIALIGGIFAIWGKKKYTHFITR